MGWDKGHAFLLKKRPIRSGCERAQDSFSFGLLNLSKQCAAYSGHHLQMAIAKTLGSTTDYVTLNKPFNL